MPGDTPLILMDAARVDRALHRMAYQMMEVAADRPVFLIGLNRNGEQLVRKIGSIMTDAGESEPLRLTLQTEEKRLVGPVDWPKVPEGAVILLVDDVLFSGETLFNVLQALPVEAAYAVHVAVLVDRGHRRLPILCRFAGLEISTKLREHVEVTLDGAESDVRLYRS
ncbi:MAG: phosphoribosyltransferase family protein [Bacteroidota bacterium]